MVEQRVFNVLVAEDENFQRLALLDLLMCCDYEGKNLNSLSLNSHHDFPISCCC